MAGGCATGLEEDLLQRAGAGFGGDLGRVGNHFGEGFQDRGAARDDGGAGFGEIPVAAVLCGKEGGRKG